MPHYLSEGNRNYNQIRRIHPHDSVARLEYYLPIRKGNSNPSSSTKSSSSQSIEVRDDEAHCSSSSSGTLPSISSYESQLADFIHKQKKSNKHVELVDYKQNYDQDVNKQSPLGSSGFSENTLIESSRRENYHGLRQYQLQDANPKALNFGVGDHSNSRFVSNNNRRYLMKGSVDYHDSEPGNGNGRSRLKRRNINRLKRRMLVHGNHHSINPYALSELFSQSEIPGFREIFASDSYLRKFCWIVAFLFMTILSLNDMTELITEYYEYPITVDLRLRDSARLPFPAVTVCNLNVVRFSSLCSSNGRFDLTNQIPSELRDKLCGIQVEKNKNNTGADSDISDINNIGIQSTTTTEIPTLDGGSTSASIPSTSMHPNPTVSDTMLTQTMAKSTQAAEHKTTISLTSPMPVTSPSSSSTHRTTAKGSLDLDDFAEPSMLLMDRGSHKRRGRSIRISESDTHPARPFASSKSLVRLWYDTSSTTRTNSDQYRIHVAQASGQVNKFNFNAANSAPANRVGQQSNVVRGNIGQNSGTSPTTNTNTTPLPVVLSNVTSFVPAALPDDFELTERQERELQENLTNWLAVMYNRDPKLTLSLGHQFDDMILRCTMKSINCTRQRSFENSFSPTEGNCFTYRSRVKRKSQSSSKQSTMERVWEDANLAGTNHGLELVLNLEKNEYISGSSQVGALVMIHHPSDLGYAASEATFVAPEFTTYIGLKMVNVTRLPAPYPEYCVDTWPAKFADTLTHNSTYSQQACLRICLQKTIQSHCQCQSAFLPIVELDSPPPPESIMKAANQNTLSPSNTSSESSTGIEQQSGNNVNKNIINENRIIICDTRRVATRQCVREVMFRAADRVHNCDCPPKCQVVRYDKTISMARWPTREDKVAFDRGKTDVNFQNLAKVIVYFQTMTCEEVSQQAVFNAAKLFSALGGIMGMYVGFSFLSVFEIFEVMSRKLWHYLTTKIGHATSRISA